MSGVQGMYVDRMHVVCMCWDGLGVGCVRGVCVMRMGYVCVVRWLHV